MIPHNKINLESEKVIKAYRELKSIVKVGKLFNCSHVPIRRILQENGINRIYGGGRIYDTDLNYFRSIDNIEKAYILGFIASDGCNSGEKLIFNIHNKDEEVLHFIKEKISPLKNLYVNKHKSHISLSIHSRSICRDLDLIGIVKAKTKVLKFPDIEKEYYSHFIRGVFDGDGCVSFNDHGTNKIAIRFGISNASKEFIEKIEEILRINCNLKYKKLYKNNKSEAYSLEYEGCNQVEKIYKYLYNNSYFSLKRKHDKFLNYYGNIPTGA